MHTLIGPDRLARAKRSFATRNAPVSAFRAISAAVGRPAAGDLLLARVTAIGQHDRVELTDSRKARIFVGDEVILCFGARYAPDQFEADIPQDLGPCALAAAGGIAGHVLHANARMDEPTMLEPIGVFVSEQGRALNIRDFALPERRPSRKVPIIAVVGGSMNAGKTTTAASLVHGLRNAGYRVGAAKITGTGAGNDYWHMYDAGAEAVLDFTDAGLATTYKASFADLERCAHTLAGTLIERGADVIVFEIADGLFQRETAWLVGSQALSGLVDAYLYAAESAASAVMGAQWLGERSRRLLAISGLVSISPLACREAVEATGVVCAPKEQLMSADFAQAWVRLLQPALSETVAA